MILLKKWTENDIHAELISDIDALTDIHTWFEMDPAKIERVCIKITWLAWLNNCQNMPVIINISII